MQQPLEIKAFFFNARTDYLPYYKQFSIVLEEDAKAVDLLSKIKEENENFTYTEEKLVFRINGLVVDGDQNMQEVVERLGTSLQIDPVNAYRSDNGLKINDKDFMESYALLAPFASEEDLAYYETLYALHYASETEKFDHEYIGDAILVLAHKMITEGSEYKEEILDAVSSAQSGLFDCEYENNLFNAQDHSSAIDELKMMVKPPKAPSFMDKLAARFGREKAAAPTVERTIRGKHIAYYAGSVTEKTDSMHQKIVQADAKVVSFSRTYKRSGLSLLEDNKKLAYTKAATTLLDALDSGAEILIVEEKEVFSMFKKHFSAIEKTIGREIDLELISAEDFLAQVDLIEA